MKEIIRLKNIDMYFYKKGKFLKEEKKFHVLRNINLSVDEGEILAIVGESGCGKTTIGKIITGLLIPTNGEIFFEGEKITKNIKKIEEYREKVQFVQQDSYAALNPAKTIYQSLEAPIKHRNKDFTKDDVEKKIQEVMSMVGLVPVEQFLFKFPHQLSGGQRQRILIARALSLEPKLIVADEPVSMIDVSMRVSILNLMKELNKCFNIAFIYITHDLGTARYISENGRIAVMYLGEIVESGSISDTLSNPKHPYTQALISAVPLPDVHMRRTKPLPLKNMDFMSLEKRKDCCPFYLRCPYGISECENKYIKYVKCDNSVVKCCNLGGVPQWKK